MLLKMICIALVTFCSLSARSQLVEIKGKITNDKGDTLVNCTVAVKNSRNGVAANEHGEFRIKAHPGKDVLVFSYVGHVMKEVRVDSSKTITVVLQYIEPTYNDSGVPPMPYIKREPRIIHRVDTIPADSIKKQVKKDDP